MNTRIFLTLLGLVVAISCQNFEDDDDIIEASGEPAVTGGSSTSIGTHTPVTSVTPLSSLSTGSNDAYTSTTAPSGSTNTPGTGTTGSPPSAGTTALPGPTITSGTGTTGSPPSAGTAAFISTTTQPAPTIPMDSFTMPNTVNAPNAKVIYQQAVALTNHVQALSAQILTLQNEINPENSTLIIDVGGMQENATYMLSTLGNLTAQLDAANKNLAAAQDNYNNVSRTYTCIASYYGYPTTMGPSTTVTTIAPTTTVPPWTCDRNLTANGTNQTVTFDRMQIGTNCSYTVTAAAGSGTITYTLVLNVSDNGSVSVVDVNSGATLDTFNTPGNYSNSTSTTVVRFVANNAQFVNYNLTYSAFDPCSDFGCDANCSACSLNSLGQPFCKLNTISACFSIGGDGKTCQSADPCIYRGKNKCNTPETPYCIRNDTTCTGTCSATTPAPSQFLRLRDDDDEDSVRGLLHRWVF